VSRQNKVNPDHYTTAGRLSPDDLARERWKQNEANPGGGRRRKRKPMPPWMKQGAGGAESAEGAEGAEEVSPEPAGIAARAEADAQRAERPEGAVSADKSIRAAAPDEAAQEPQPKPRRRDVRSPAKRAGDRAQKKTARRKFEIGKQAAAKVGRGAAASAKRRATPKAAGARKTPRTTKAPRARASSARAGSPQRAGKPRAHKTASRGQQKAIPKKGTARRTTPTKRPFGAAKARKR
jgi:hypothetical protein